MLVCGIVCDKCRKELWYEWDESRSWFVRRTRAEGWSIGKKHLCPQCRKDQQKGV